MDISPNNKYIRYTNNSGGILGGLTTGMPLTFRVAFKPPSSISKEQKSVNLKTKKEEKLIIVDVLTLVSPCSSKEI